MEDSKKPSLDKVIKKLEELDIREWDREDNNYGLRFTARILGLKFFVFKWKNGKKYYCQLSILSMDENLFVEYYNPKNDDCETKKISDFYDKLCKDYEGYKKKEFEDAVEQFFSD